MLLITPVSELQKLFGVPERPNLKPRWNIAPTQDVAAVRMAEGRRQLALLRWGLVPPWADDPSIGARMINARAETVAGKPAFRDAFRKRRCLVPLDGFYEWRAEGRRKQGFAIRRRDRAPFALAGLWERWPGPKRGEPPTHSTDRSLETATVITTTANATLKPLHERMPVVLAPQDWELWLDPATPPPVLEGLLKPAPDELLEFYPVGPRVNSVRNDDEACAAPLLDARPDEAPDDQPTLF
jgi:putative SOS response-associated peptidase YedK